MSHTKVPWRAVIEADERHHRHVITAIELEAAMDAGEPAPHPLIASALFGRGHVDASTAEANCKFIVKACNNHERLISMLARFIEITPEYSQAVIDARALLKELEAE